MKSSLHIILFGSLLIFLTACSSTRVITLEMKIPPKITMPLKVENVIVLNNAAVQSSENINWGYRKEGVKIDVDTIPWIAAHALSDALLESDLFSQIDAYSKPIREDNDFLAQVKIEKEILSDFFTNLDYDAIISIDRVIYVWEQQAESPGESKKIFNRGLTLNRMQGLLSCGIYTKDRITPLTTFDVRDSIQFYSYNDGDVLVREAGLESFFPYLTRKMAETAANKFISTWERSDRTLFTSSSARMKEAYACVNSKDWLQAKTLWMDLFEQSNKPKNKARLSSNIAVAYEILGNFQEALEWAQKSKSYFEEMRKNVDPDEFEWIGTYVPILEKRIMDNKLLDEQQAIR